MSGIYIHIPFCTRKCLYCNFYSVTDLHQRSKLVSALMQEIILQKNYLGAEKISSIYFGGGTPSLLMPETIQKLIEQISTYYSISKDVEITMELNPDSISNDYIKQLRHTTVNRVSLGMQSLFDDDLAYLGRIHSAKQAQDAFYLLQDNYTNISVDFIYGIPGSGERKWTKTLTFIINAHIPHVSLYNLTVEENTPLRHMINNKQRLHPKEDLSIRQYKQAVKTLSDAGYRHYEISNFALQGYYSRHNSAYWQQKKYLGIGPSAHSFNGHSRQWNTADINKYIIQLGNKHIPCVTEDLTDTMKFNEYILTRIRTEWGIDLNYIKNTFGQHLYNHVAGHLPAIEDKGWANTNNSLTLTEEGMLFSDKIAEILFVLETK